MVLVPIRCPNCGASVDLEEGQTRVRCAYCRTTSFLPAPAAPNAHPLPPSPGAPAPEPAPAAASPKKFGFVLLIIPLLLITGATASYFVSGGVVTNYVNDARPVASILEDIEGDGRFLKIVLTGNHIYAEVLGDDGTAVSHRFDGRFARAPKSEGKVGDLALAKTQSFALDEVSFDVVAEIVRHAGKRAAEAELSSIELSRRWPDQAELLWTVSMKQAGDVRRFHYSLEGKPLVDEALDFIALEPKDVPKRFERVLGAKARIVSVSLSRDYARFEVMAPKSQRDTDSYRFTSEGIVSAATPLKSDGDADELQQAIFSLADIDWAAVRRAVADAVKHIDAQVRDVTIRRRNGELRITIYGRTEREAIRSAHYDASGKRLAE